MKGTEAPREKHEMDVSWTVQLNTQQAESFHHRGCKALVISMVAIWLMVVALILHSHNVAENF